MLGQCNLYYETYYNPFYEKFICLVWFKCVAHRPVLWWRQFYKHSLFKIFWPILVIRVNGMITPCIVQFIIILTAVSTYSKKYLWELSNNEDTSLLELSLT